MLLNKSAGVSLGAARQGRSLRQAKPTSTTTAAVKDVFMPALSSTMTEGKIVSWLKQPGDKVSKGEPIVVVESDKGKCLSTANRSLPQCSRVCHSPGLEAGIAVLPTARVCTV